MQNEEQHPSFTNCELILYSHSNRTVQCAPLMTSCFFYSFGNANIAGHFANNNNFAMAKLERTFCIHTQILIQIWEWTLSTVFHIASGGNFTWSLTSSSSSSSRSSSTIREWVYELPHSHENTFNILHITLSSVLYQMCSFWPNCIGHNFHCIALQNSILHSILPTLYPNVLANR